jgi:hypothetical protein
MKEIRTKRELKQRDDIATRTKSSLRSRCIPCSYRPMRGVAPLGLWLVLTLPEVETNATKNHLPSPLQFTKE